MSNLKNNKGFTLIELLISLVIIGILASIALPSYQQYIRRTHRIDGVTTLNDIQLAQEKFRTTNTSYGSLAQVWTGSTSPNGYYTLTVTGNSATGYTVTGTAVGDQANDVQAGVSCSVLTLTVNGIVTSRTPTACWNR